MIVANKVYNTITEQTKGYNYDSGKTYESICGGYILTLVQSWPSEDCKIIKSQ